MRNVFVSVTSFILFIPQICMNMYLSPESQEHLYKGMTKMIQIKEKEIENPEQNKALACFKNFKKEIDENQGLEG